MKNIIVVLMASLMSVAAFAKITIFTNDEVAIHVLKSPELNKLKSNPGGLSGTQLVGLSIRQSGMGIGTVYDLTLNYRHVGVGFKSCSVNARVINQKVEHAPVGITASELSRPKFSEVRCAM